MTLTPSLRQIALEALRSPECACGNPKTPKQAFCRRCYYALPLRLQSALWRCFSEGYAEAYDAGVDWLRENGFLLKKRPPGQGQLFPGGAK